MPTSTIVGKAASAFVLSRFNQNRPLGQILDVGAGCGSYRRLLGPFLPDTHWIAVEVWEPYIEAYGLKQLYQSVYKADATRFDLSLVDPGGAIFLGDVIEHIPVWRAIDLVTAAMERFDVAMLSIPIGEWPQEDVGGNPHEAHVASWYDEDIGRRFSPTLAGVVRHDFNGVQALAVVFLGRTEEIRQALAEEISAFQAESDRDPDLAFCGLEFCPNYQEPGVLSAFHGRMRDLLGLAPSFSSQFADLARFLDIGSLVDAGCGDFSWMEQVSGQFTLYVGLDRDKALIADLDARHGHRRGHFFAVRDLAHAPLPAVDAILCRDLFAENDIETVSAILALIKTSGARYLMASTTPGAPAPLDLRAPPFNLPPPLLQFQEQANSAKLMGIWQIPRG